MKYKPISLFLLLLLLFCALTSADAAVITNKEWHADLSVLMSESSIPKSYSIEYTLPDSFGETYTTRTIDVEKINSSGLKMCVSFDLATENAPESWAETKQWLSDKVGEMIKGVPIEPEMMARAVAAGVELSSHGDWCMTKITVTVPYITPLKSGDKGSEAKKLQETLIRYGFLDDTPDGTYGAKTRTAVLALENYVRDLERDIILATYGAVADEKSTSATTDPEAEAQPSAQPQQKLYAPETVADGIADAQILAYLYSDEFKLVRSGLKIGDKGIDVSRVQTRLTNLHYYTGTIDGIFGSNLAYALKLFQYYNSAAIADEAEKSVLELLFSDQAKAAPYLPMTEGTRGDRVTELQTRLKLLGFTSDAPDAIYGASTVATVKVLQQYMIDKGLKATSSQGGEVTVEVNGIADSLLLEAFYSDTFPYASTTLQNGSSGVDVKRMQLRLKELKYLESASSVDGKYGSGSTSAIKSFQSRHGLSQTGIADSTTLTLLFSEDAREALKPYKLIVSIADQRVYVYTYDSNGEYTQLIKTFICSTGRNSSPTPKGTFTSSTGPGARWHYFTKFSCWAQYAYYIQGDIMFHSVLYNQKDGPVTQSSVNHLGSQASHGCVRLAVEDAKWIWDNCPAKTTVIVE